MSVPQGHAQRKNQASSLRMVKALSPVYGGGGSRKGVSGLFGDKEKRKKPQSGGAETPLLRQDGCAVLQGLAGCRL